MTGVAVVVFSAPLAHAAIADAAQEPGDPPAAMCGQDIPITNASCRKEFDDWQSDEKAWRKNRQIFGNHVTYKGVRVTQIKRTDPPVWIKSYCAPELETDAAIRLSPICEAYDDYLRYDWTQHVEGPTAVVTSSKRVQVSSGETHGFVDYLLKNLHYDGPWTNSQNGARAYGLFGTHLTLAHMGRVYLWGPPGMLVVRRPEGQTDIRMTWGVDIFVADIPIGQDFRLPLYFSIAKVFGQHEKQAIQSGVNAGMDMVGFSFTIRR